MIEVDRAYHVKPYSVSRTETAANNSGRNIRDRDSGTLTPLDQGGSHTDVSITTQIRKAILASAGMSVNAQNVKIITVNGRVTLRGPVNTTEEKQTIGEIAHEKHTKAPEGVAVGGGTGGVIGGALGWIAGIGALAIPGVGPFIAAGPIIAALSGAAIGAAIGGIAGGLIGLGIPEIEAKRYEGKLKKGNILISVHAENSAEITRAKNIFATAGAEDICITGEASTPRRAPARSPRATDRVAQPTMASYSGSGR